MHRDSRWALELLALQDEQGKWGSFHSLSRTSRSPVTTEQALRRLQRAGYTMTDPCIQRAVAYMEHCLSGEETLPDRPEKTPDWDVFVSLMLAAWIVRFTPNSPAANRIADQWTRIITRSFARGAYCAAEYAFAYRETFGLLPCGGRMKDFVNFYPLALLHGRLDQQTGAALVEYVLAKEDGVYYVYDRPLSLLPACFASREASQYLGAIELLTGYPSAGEKLRFVADWILSNRNAAGRWDMGSGARDGVYFPLSSNWRRRDAREADCTYRMQALLRALSAGQNDAPGR